GVFLYLRRKGMLPFLRIRLGKLWLWTRNLELLTAHLLSRCDAATDSTRRAGALPQVSTGQEEQVRARTQSRKRGGAPSTAAVQRSDPDAKRTRTDDPLMPKW
ncbi:hypothetical protein VaNZ11_011200, partial [Volvox africanus]